jgi:L-idonate 5-dehydrogenase
LKSVVIHAAKDLRIEERPEEEPGTGQLKIKIEAGGICGSDLHYYQHGGFGTIRVREPMILGHEIAGTVSSLGAGVSHLSIGDKVAVSPSRPCSHCDYCLKGQQNHCLNMRFYGSAMPMPHIQGGFRQSLVAEAWQCHKVEDHVSINEAAFAEPLAVVLHGLKRAGSLLGKRVLITGCGPIGMLCLLSARVHGATEIVVTDILDEVLEKALELGADKAINVAKSMGDLAAYNPNKGYFDVMFEASGNEHAIRAGMEALKPRSIIVQLGLSGGEIAFPINMVVSKEVDIRGSFRFHEEFASAVHHINKGTINVAPLLTGIYPIEKAIEAFEIAGDRSKAIKVQLSF